MKIKLSGYYMLPSSTEPISFDFDDAFDTKFMKKYTNCKNFEQFLEHGRFNIKSQKDFEDLPEDIMDKYVAKNTKFASWREMIDAATDRHLKRSMSKPAAGKN